LSGSAQGTPREQALQVTSSKADVGEAAQLPALERRDGHAILRSRPFL
jgi:hypothetical protein